MMVGREINVLTRHFTLAWLLQSPGLNGRLARWVALLSNWTLAIRKRDKGEDELLGTLAASTNPREEVDEVLIATVSKNQPRQTINLPPPTVRKDDRLLVISFDGSARLKKKSGAFSAIIWQLPEWKILAAGSKYTSYPTVNEAEY